MHSFSRPLACIIFLESMELYLRFDKENTRRILVEEFTAKIIPKDKRKHSSTAAPNFLHSFSLHKNLEVKNITLHRPLSFLIPRFVLEGITRLRIYKYRHP